MSQVQEWIVENKDKIEKGVEIIGQGCEVLAATVGQLNPILEAVFLAAAELLGNPEGREARYFAEQFEKIHHKLDGIQKELDQIDLALKRANMNKQNFNYEAKILSQFEKFQDFVNAKPNFKEKKKQKFITQYENTNGNLSIDALYNAVIGENISYTAILDTVVMTEKRSRKPVEEFCASLKKLFVMGIIADIGHTALTEEEVGKDKVKTWQDRMEKIETRMKAAVDDCIKNFPLQAKTDVEQELLEKKASIDPEFTGIILDILKKKYYWVSWSVRVFNHSGMFFWNWLAGKTYYGDGGGGNFFELLSNNIRIVVSYNTDPKPINKSQIADQIEKQNLKGNMQSVAQTLQKTLPNTVVYATSVYKNIEEKNNFQPECFYFAKHKKAYLCIHSE